MANKVVKCILYLLGGLNMGIASAFFPIFLVIFVLIFGLSPITTPLGLSAIVCGGIITALFLLHYKKLQKRRSSVDYRVTYAYIGFMLGVAIAILIALTWGKSELGNITGY